MLSTLAIRDFILVDRVELDFAQGFSVLTGETGAGKSILLDALTLALGGRAESGVIRPNAGRAEISAAFDLSHLPKLREWLAGNDLGDDSSCWLRRVLDDQGKSRGYINGRPAPVGQMREVGEALVDLYGQHAHQSLLRSDAQRQLLDGYGGLRILAEEVATAWRAWQSLLGRHGEASLASGQLTAERDLLTQRGQDLSNLALNPDEWRQLLAEQTRLAHSAGLLEGTEYAVQALSGEDESCEAQVTAVLSRLSAMAKFDPALVETAGLLESAQIQMREAAYNLRQYQQKLELDPTELHRVETRLSEIQDVARKYRTRAEELPTLLDSTRARLEELNAGLDVEVLARQVEAAKSEYAALASTLRSKREIAAGRLSTKVTEAIQSLALAGGRFEVDLRPIADGASYGTEQVEFMVSANAGLPTRPLAKVASGGELSRLSLAIQVVTSAVAQVPTLIFDEVDVGIGGGVAEIVGRLLRSLGETRQVLCVTHLAQVAARAHRHYVVSKGDNKGTGVAVDVRELDIPERIEEVARMLGGTRITEKTLAHAREMVVGT